MVDSVINQGISFNILKLEEFRTMGTNGDYDQRRVCLLV